MMGSQTKGRGQTQSPRGSACRAAEAKCEDEGRDSPRILKRENKTVQ